MLISLSNDQVLGLRLRAQRLMGRQQATVTDIAPLVKDLCAIQAQDAQAAALALHVRSVGLLAEDVEQARIGERTIIRTWGFRNTLHLLTTEDLGWLLPLLGPVFIAGSQRRRVELGLDEDTYTKGISIIRTMLASKGPLTRAELVEQLASHSLFIEGQARPYLLNRAALEGVICLGPNRGTEPTYVLLNDWVKLQAPLSQEAALTELMHRYLNAYEPATLEDMATWSGLSISKIRAAWRHMAEHYTEVKIGNNSAWMSKIQATALDQPLKHPLTVRLLSAFDSYLLGYRKRELAVPPQYTKRINAGGGMLHPILLVDGRVVGTWKLQRKTHHVDVHVEPFEHLTAAIHAALEEEVVGLAHFLSTEAKLYVVPRISP